jgi:phenylalanyl-tRNA synthetase alpha chain
MSLSEELYQIENDARRVLNGVSNKETLEEFRLEFLSRQGALSLFLRGLKDASLEDKRTVGKRANDLRANLENDFATKERELSGKNKKKIDVTIPGSRPAQGHLHPLTIVRRDIEDLFMSMGFEIADTPEVEEPKYNFDMVNIPLDHPARDLMDTFWLNDGRLLRTHTSAGQARVMTNRKPPFRILIPGRVFRHEATDASHETTFYQYEGLFVDDKVSLVEFKGIISEILPKLLKKDVKIRMRPSYFPFVEPGVEIDVSCFFCKTGCSVCKQSGWLEVMGAGMVHPNVLRNVNIDPKKYRGFAFGGSIDRLAMLRFGIKDIRLFWSGEPHFLKQF